MRRVVTTTAAGVALAAALGIGVAAANGTGPGRVSDALAALVSRGTLTQEQADEVARALDGARDEALADRQRLRQQRAAEVDALLEDTLGLTRSEVRDQLRDGRSLRQIAGDRAPALADGFVALVRSHADRAVADGRMTRAQADRRVQSARDRADAWLDGDAAGLGLGLGMMAGDTDDGGMGAGMMGGIGRWHQGPGMMGDWDDDETAATGSTGTTGV